MDGVYAEQPNGSMLFHPLPAPSDEDIARLARAVCRKVTRYLGQLTGEDKDQQLTLDHLANASVQGLVATGPPRVVTDRMPESGAMDRLCPRRHPPQNWACFPLGIGIVWVCKSV
jgi:hypothetical protein